MCTYIFLTTSISIYTVHRAYDIAQATAYMFAGSYPSLHEVDRIEFSRPIDIGDLVRLSSRVVYTSCAVSRIFIHLYI